MNLLNISQSWPEKRKKLADLARKLPNCPGVYLMQDGNGECLYIGKASSLKKRVSSYFLESADLGPWKQGMLPNIENIETIKCPSSWEALLLESRLIKDHRPKYNTLQLDDRTYPYLVITTKEDFPGVYITRTPSEGRFKSAKKFGPFTSVGALHQAVHVLQTIFKFRTCDLTIDANDKSLRFFRPCLLHAIDRCTAPCGAKINKTQYKESINRLVKFLASKRSVVIREMRAAMEEASSSKAYERAAELRDQINAIEKLENHSGKDAVWQSEITVFAQDASAGMKSLRRILNVDSEFRFIEAFDIAHLQGQETVGAKVAFMDGKPYKEGYRRFKIKSSMNDDYQSMREVISRRYRDASRGLELFPDLILIDGGLGQLTAAMEVFSKWENRPQHVVSIAKKEELIYVPELNEPIKLGRNNEGLKLLQKLRDEAHRFAQHYHHFLRHKKFLGDR